MRSSGAARIEAALLRVPEIRRSGVEGGLSVMEFAGRDEDSIVLHFVNEPMLFGDAARPIAGEVVLESLRLSEAREG